MYFKLCTIEIGCLRPGQNGHQQKDPDQREEGGGPILPVRGHPRHGPVRLDLLQGQGGGHLQVTYSPVKDIKK